MGAVTRLDDPFARLGLTLPRGTGLRLGELLDLELDSVRDSASHGSWFKVPLGKLGTERTAPLDAITLLPLGARQHGGRLPPPGAGRPRARPSPGW